MNEHLNNHEDGRWAGRDSRKDVVRNRVWHELEVTGSVHGAAVSTIPNFIGSEKAAALLSSLPFWKEASLVKSNPDAGQAPVRLLALQEGKRVYTPVPELVADYPFVELDPVRLKKDGIAFEEVMYSQGAMKYGKPLQFEEMDPMDVLVVGCVAVTRAGGRTGKGAGFADLELGIFRELGLIPNGAPLVTTVHPIQLVPNSDVVMAAHDSPLDWIITTGEIIETMTVYPRPKGVDWDSVQPDQFENIPFLREMMKRITT